MIRKLIPGSKLATPKRMATGTFFHLYYFSLSHIFLKESTCIKFSAFLNRKIDPERPLLTKVKNKNPKHNMFIADTKYSTLLIQKTTDTKAVEPVLRIFVLNLIC